MKLFMYNLVATLKYFYLWQKLHRYCRAGSRLRCNCPAYNFSFVCQKCSLITTLIEGVAGSSLAVCYIVCAGALTFKDDPATYIGSQYLSAWAGFFLGCSMVSSVLKESLVNRSRVSESEAVQTSAPKTQPNPQQECHVSIPIEAEISV